MRNHGEKVKDMAESVLPSTARTYAREQRRRVHRRQRTRQRDLLVIARRTAFDGALTSELADVAETDFEADFEERRRAQDIAQLVWARRAADKTGPLTRWAGAQVDRDASLREAPPSEQVAHFARLVPDNLIGRHALQHIESDLEYRARQAEWLRRKAARAEAKVDALRNQVVRDAGTILRVGRHREVNAALRAGYRARATAATDGTIVFPRPARFLHGGHDVTEFAQVVVGHAWIVQVVHATANRAA
ncbi:hypothetical protein I6A60_08795 [Frankia sp. AgB1.9]|uniref:hypothetical protein n=1 Tax=unclassified Frankia TaxID=2632575 RepID=UPI001931A1E2|nr:MULTISPECIES: hypothetical protein [unclassified Frankia]MBL7487222.1 hypothetical protein [Frankia sp. AgW1.1]MBL7547968.1 hypothetical protein [Frankia sp. AgB1.9]MBL7625039.1 hypothetical protein [Frankia sp. AgB1.8]